MPQQVQVNAANMSGLVEAADELGIDITARMQQIELDPALLTGSAGLISWPQFNHLLELVAREDGCEDFSLRVARRQDAGSFSLLSRLMKLCPDMGTALAKAEEYSPVLTQASFWNVSTANGITIVARSASFNQREQFGQSAVLGIAQAVQVFQAACGVDWKPSSIRLVRPRPSKAVREQFTTFFRATVHFGQDLDALVFPERDLKRPIATADPLMLEIMENHARSLIRDHSLDDRLDGNVRSLIRSTLGSPSCNIKSVAQLLSMHPKTLSRELNKVGCTFRQLLNEERHNRATYLLSEYNLKLPDLADRLGYSDVTALSRAFRNQCGQSPREWKKARLANE